MLIEGHIFRTGNFSAIIGVNNLGMVAPGDFLEALHDALYVHYHGIEGAGDYSQFLLQVVAGDGHAVPHHDLVGRTAHACQRSEERRVGEEWRSRWAPD